MNRWISLILCVALVIGFLPQSTRAVEKEPEVEITTEMLASDLKTLGLFKGVSETDFALERKPTRTEAIVMLIRVLGKEEVALNGAWEHPFDDVPTWAAPYVGYAYTHGLTGGISATKFGSNNIAPDYMYLTFVLRALGYSDKDGAFVWNSPYALASDVGILPKEYNKDNFLRGDVVNISYAALNALMRDSQQTLADTLIECGSFSEETYNEIYRLGAVQLDIDPFIELRKMIKQHGEYDEKANTYSLVVEYDDTPYSHFVEYARGTVYSFSENDTSILLRYDSNSTYVNNDGGKRSEQKSTEYYTIRLTENTEAYQIEGYDKTVFVTSGNKTEVTSAFGTVNPGKWNGSTSSSYRGKDNNMIIDQGPYQYQFKERDSGIYGNFISYFAFSLDKLIKDLGTTMEKYGLSTTLDDFGFVYIPVPTNYLSELLYEGNVSNEDLERLRKYDMTYDPKHHKSYSEGAAYYDPHSMEDKYGSRSADFKDFQEAHDYLSVTFSDQERFESKKLGLAGVASSFDVLMNLFMAEAAAEIDYASENIEIEFLTNRNLIYHAEYFDSWAVNVRGICKFTIKNTNTTEWTQEDHDAVKKPFQSSQHLQYISFSDLIKTGSFPKTIDVDVHLDTINEVTSTNVMILDYDNLDILKQSKVTVYGAENGIIEVNSKATIVTDISVKHGESPVTQQYCATEFPEVHCKGTSGYWISDLIINGKSFGPRVGYPLEISGKDISVKAVFKKIEDPVKLTISIRERAGIWVFCDGVYLGGIFNDRISPEIIVPRGTKITVRIKTNATGQKITEVLMNGENCEIQEEYTLSVTEDLTIFATT